MRDLEKSELEGICQICGADLDHHSRDAVKAKLTDLKLRNFGFEPAALLEAMNRQKLYERFKAPEAVAEMLLRNDEMGSAIVMRTDLDARIRRIDNEMSGRRKGDLEGKLSKYKSLSGQVRDLEDRVSKMDELLRQKAGEHAAKQRQLNALPDADPKLSLQVKTYRALEMVFQSAMAGFREQARKTVEADSSRIFQQLTTEKAYRGLRINETYGLSILDHDGNAVPGRSTGAEQIVALSLVGGLNRAAVREGPVVMDTNLGRLDLGHRHNLLRFLPQLGPQVVVLVHSGELPKDVSLSDFDVRVARRYEVHRVSETRSEIEELD
jgi:DNA sulfur modification protein DndD